MELGPYILLASLEGAVTAAVLALTAVGLALVFGVMRVVNIAHGEFFMLGAVMAWWIAQTVGGHPAHRLCRGAGGRTAARGRPSRPPPT